MSLKKIELKDLQLNPITTFLQDWPLLTAGNKTTGYNTMTIAWGHLGGIWGKPTLNVYIRPQRFTKTFVDEHEFFTVSVLPANYKETLRYLGTVSGRMEDKINKADLTPMFDQAAPYFAEAKLVFICRKIYQVPILETGFLDTNLQNKVYPEKDFHDMYVGEIMDVLICSDSTLSVTD